jgi:uncharacterized protein (DUF2236 family)
MNPLAATIGILRAAVIEMLDPYTLAAVVDSGAAEGRTASRWQRTMEYVAAVEAGDSGQAVYAADVLTRIHEHVRGVEPISQQHYDANDPAGQLWILLTNWESTLCAYEKLGAGRLTPEDDRRYWAECRMVAQFQTCDPEDVPGSSMEMAAYYQRVRPRLAASEATVRVIRHYLDNTAVLFERLPFRPPGMELVTGSLIRRATIATIPDYMRRIAGIQQGPLDVLAVQAIRAMYRAYSVSPRREEMLAEVVKILAPETARVLVPRLLKVEPVNPVVVAPADAWEGRRTPRELYRTGREERPSEVTCGADDLLSFNRDGSTRDAA